MTDGTRQGRRIETSASIISLSDEGIIYDVSPRAVRFTMEQARESMAAYLEITGGLRSPLLVDIRQVQGIDRAARQHLTGPDGERAVSAVALLADSALTRAIGNFFIGLNRPSFPVRVFTSEEEALRWLRGYLPGP